MVCYTQTMEKGAFFHGLLHADHDTPLHRGGKALRRLAGW